MTSPLVVLASMPWTTLRAPSIQIGTVAAILEQSGIPARTAHLYVDFFDHVRRVMPGDVDIDAFEAFGSIFGEWVFAVPPFRTASETADERFRMRLAREFGGGMIDLAFTLRRLVPAFLDRCVEEIMATSPRVVGLTSTFNQTVPSLVLAKMLKAREPEIRIVLGGSNCEGPMGAAIHRLYPWVDVVVRGEGEKVVPRLFAELVAGDPISPQPGLCIRNGEAATVVPEQVPSVQMRTVPLPLYDDYFARVANSSLGEEKLWLPYETSRGCWWGLVHLCTFCAANGQTVTFRSKPAAKVLDELPTLARRYGVDDIWLVDNILDEKYMHGLFPQLIEQQNDFSLFVETKAHVSKDNLRRMRDAGVVMAQVGVESLSTPILKLMDKGTSAIQNIRTLKWCAELGIKAFWNLIYGFPGEDPDDYARMAAAIPALIHLEAPNPPVQLRLDRFSPYHKDPARYGILATGPLPVNRFVHPVEGQDLLDLQYFFSFRYEDGRQPDSYTRAFRDACAHWRRGWRENYGRLSYRYDGDTIVIEERRSNRPPDTQRLSALHSRLYLACDAGVTAERAWHALDTQDRDAISVAEVAAWLDAMAERAMMFVDNGVYLALAVGPGEGAVRRASSLTGLDALCDVRTTVAAEARAI